MKNDVVSVAILVLPGAAASVTLGMYDLFLSANGDWEKMTNGETGRELIRPILVSRDGCPIAVSNGVEIAPHSSLESCPEVEVICIPSISIAPAEFCSERFSMEVAWLRERCKKGALLAASCSGPMLLAETGLLDGYEATVHWAWCNEMRRRYPEISVRERRALLLSGFGQRLIMAGAGTTWMDLALYVIARKIGAEKALQVAQIWLIDWHHIGQQSFARLACSGREEDAVVAECQVWIGENYMQANPVSAVVRMSGLAERTFKRRFKRATGMSPLEYVHTLRLEEAKQLLESGGMPIEAIANEIGYADAGFFNRLFRRKVNLTPAQYRRRFASARRPLSGHLEPVPA